jgi:uncharacterized protein YndB with AHSA1/START domain
METKEAPTKQQTTSTGTVRLHRVFTAPPERIYKAVIDAAANCKWLAPHGFTCTVHHLDAKVGGTYRMTFTNFGTGSSHSFGGKYLELEPGKRIVATDVFEDPNLPGEMRTTWTSRRSPWVRKSTSFKRTYPQRSLLKRATSAGRNRWNC